MPDTERELFESAMSNEPEAQPVTIAEPEAPQQPEPETAEDRARDEKGRFAPKAEAEPDKPVEAIEPEAPQETEPVVPVKEPEQVEDRIPSWRLKEEAEAKREAVKRAEEAERRAYQLQAQMQQLQAQSQQQNVPKPNLFENPEQWEQTQQQQFQSALQMQSLQFSEQLARIKYGDETYDAAERAAQQVMASGQMDPMLMSVRNAPSPGVALVEWHKKKQTLERVGPDPDKFLEQERERWKNDPAIQAEIIALARAQAQANPGPATNNPLKTMPSLNRQTSAASTNPGSEDESDSALFKAALRR